VWVVNFIRRRLVILTGISSKRKYILNPAYNYLTKVDKIKEFQKCKSEHTKEEILASADMNKSYIELSDELGFCPSTIRKYLKSEGIDLIKMKSEEKYRKFEEVYYAPENTGKSIRQLSAILGISKSQVSRYVNRIKNELD
jgi:DNA-directed RNA polymerase specialized sigma subunit